MALFKARNKAGCHLGDLHVQDARQYWKTIPFSLQEDKLYSEEEIKITITFFSKKKMATGGKNWNETSELSQYYYWLINIWQQCVLSSATIVSQNCLGLGPETEIKNWI